MKALLILLFVLALSPPVVAQGTADVTGWNVNVLGTSGDPLTAPAVVSRAVTVAQAQCGKDALPVPTGTLTNPTLVEIDDPVSTTTPKKKCQLAMPSPVPVGTYRVAVSAFGSCGGAICTSPRGVAPGSFLSALPAQTPPAAPTNVLVKQP